MNNKRIIVILVLIFLFLFLFIYQKNYFNPNQKYLSLTFDDGYEDQYLNGFPILEKYDIDANSYIITNLTYFEGYRLLNLNQLKKLADNGWEIGSHSLNHYYMTKLSDEAILFELNESKQVLLNNGFNVKSFSVPYGDYGENIKNKAKLYYDSVRTSEWGINKLNNIDRYELKSKWMINSTSVSEMKSWVDQLSDGDWLIIMIHHVEEDKSKDLYSVSPQDLEELIKYTLNKNIKIKTISEVLNEYK